MDETRITLPQKLAAEAIGSAFLFGAVIGSGIMGQNLAEGNVGLALLANTLSTGAILFVLIAMLGPISGAHFNPAVTFAFLLRREMAVSEAGLFVAAQLLGGVLGACAAHIMFDLPLIDFSTTQRTGIGPWTGELVATFGLVLTILLLLRHRPAAIPAGVALYITSAYWFTSSTSFANPAITIVRSLSDTFAGIAPGDVPMFILFQLAGAIAAVGCAAWLSPVVVRK
ncbi:MAG: aquaporin [Pseudomonadota bacterium]